VGRDRGDSRSRFARFRISFSISSTRFLRRSSTSSRFSVHVSHGRACVHDQLSTALAELDPLDDHLIDAQQGAIAGVAHAVPRPPIPDP
jgi:hypothetical protein